MGWLSALRRIGRPCSVWPSKSRGLGVRRGSAIHLLTGSPRLPEPTV